MASAAIYGVDLDSTTHRALREKNFESSAPTTLLEKSPGEKNNFSGALRGSRVRTILTRARGQTFALTKLRYLCPNTTPTTVRKQRGSRELVDNLSLTASPSHKERWL